MAFAVAHDLFLAAKSQEMLCRADDQWHSEARLVKVGLTRSTNQPQTRRKP